MATSHLGDEPADVVGRDPGGRLEDRAEGGLVVVEAGHLACPERAVGGPRERSEDRFRDLEVDQPGVLVLIHIKDDRAGDRVKQVAGGEVAIGLEHHLERERDVKQADLARGVEGVDPRLGRRAGFEERALGRMLDSARGVVADLLDRLFQRVRPEAKEVRGHDVVGHLGWGAIGQPLLDDSTEDDLSSVGVVAEDVQCPLVEQRHDATGLGSGRSVRDGVRSPALCDPTRQDNRKTGQLHQPRPLFIILERSQVRKPEPPRSTETSLTIWE